jgi:hypothetical protein
VDVLADVGFQNDIVHAPGLFLRVERLFFQVETVGAIEVADRANGLGQHMETVRWLEFSWPLHRRVESPKWPPSQNLNP